MKYDKWLFGEAKHECSLEQWFFNVHVLESHLGTREWWGKPAAQRDIWGQPAEHAEAHLQQEGWKEEGVSSPTPPTTDRRVGRMVQWRVAGGQEGRDS